jgi:hypothetical protein
MNKAAVFLILLAAVYVQPLFAQDLVPATSEDMQEFDRQVAKQIKPKSKGNLGKPSNFGSQVSEEARKLKDASDDQGDNFGKWVSSQRKKSDQGEASAAASVGNGNGNNGNRGKKPDRTKK